MSSAPPSYQTPPKLPPAPAREGLVFVPAQTYGPTVGRNWVPLVVVLLVSAAFAQASIAVFEVQRAAALVAQYIVWAVCVAPIMSIPRQLPGRVRPKSPARKSLVAFLLALIVTTFIVWFVELRSNITDVVLQSAALVFMTLPFFVLHSAARVADVDRAVLLTCHVILALCLISIVGDFTGITNYEHQGGRYFGFLGDQSAWVLTLPLLVYFSDRRLILAAATIVVLALTASRAPAICVAAALSLLMLFSHGRRFQYIATFLIMGLLALYQSQVFSTLAGRLSATEFGSSDRIVTARLGLKIFADSPIFGAGYNSYVHFFPVGMKRMLTGQLPSQTSTFVQMLSDGGVLLFLPYLAFVIALTVAGIGLLRRSRSLADPGIVNGAIAWLLAMLWINQSATWFVVGSYIGPLVFGVAGIVGGYWAWIRPVIPSSAQRQFNGRNI
jgi:O-antigen ligase